MYIHTVPSLILVGKLFNYSSPQQEIGNNKHPGQTTATNNKSDALLALYSTAGPQRLQARRMTSQAHSGLSHVLSGDSKTSKDSPGRCYV